MADKYIVQRRTASGLEMVAELPCLENGKVDLSWLPVVGTMGSAIIERGSNANGEYVKFADGTMWCWGIKEVSFQSGTNYQFPITFPAAFIDGKIAGYACHYSSPSAFMILRNLQPSTTGSGATWYVFPANNGTPSSTPVNYHWHDIGRWKQ